MFSGAVSGLRNPRAHGFIRDDPERALEFIAFVSLLAKLLDEAKKPERAAPRLRRRLMALMSWDVLTKAEPVRREYGRANGASPSAAGLRRRVALRSRAHSTNLLSRSSSALRSGLDVDGAALMQKAFSPNGPVLKFNDLSNQSDRDEQLGFMNMFSGAVSGLRNPRASNRSANSSRAGSPDDGVAGCLSIVASRSDAARTNATAFLSSPRVWARIPAAAKRWTST
jgi:uncharacterized protein (TIGR02391 family)